MASPRLADILDKLMHLPPGENPFTWLDEVLDSAFIPRYTRSARIQLALIVALHALCVLLLLASLVLRYRNGRFWLFRMQTGVIVPNLATVPAVAAIVEVALFEVLLIGVVNMMKGRIPDSYGYSILLVGVLPAIVGEFVTWSITAGFILHTHKTHGLTSSIRRWTVFCNVLGILTPLIHFGCFLPIDILVGRSYKEALESYRTIEDFLAIQASSWTPSDGFGLSSLGPVASPFTSLQSTFFRLRKLWTIAYCFHAIADILLIVALTTIATLYLLSVGKVIRRARHEVAESGRGGETLLKVQQTWTLLAVVLVMFLLLASSSLCLALYAAIHPLATPEGYVFTSFWVSTILKTLCSSLLLFQTCRSRGLSSDDSHEEDLRPREEDNDVKGQKPKRVRSAFAPSTVVRETPVPWWERIRQPHRLTPSTKTTTQDGNLARAGNYQGRFGVASVSVMVEVFSRVETIEEEHEREFFEEIKHRSGDGVTTGSR